MIYTCGVNRIDYREVTVENIYSYFKNKSEIQVDVETSGKDPHSDKIISLQLGDKDNQFFVDCRIVNVLRFKDLLESGKLILGQNFKFDYKMLKAVGIMVENIYDTMVTECVLYCGYDKWGYGLDKLVERYLGVKISKEERKGFMSQGDRPFEASQIEYGCTDVRHLQEIRDKQMIRAREEELEYCINLENQVLKALGDIEFNGMYLNKEKWLQNTESYKKKLAETLADLDAVVLNEPKLSKYVPHHIQGNLFGFEQRRLKINYDSPVQVLKIFKDLGYEVEGTGDRELAKLVKIEEKDGVFTVIWSKHEFFTKLWFYRKYAKIVSTYGESFLKYINPATGRVHTSFWQIAQTGRVTSGNKDDNAPNVQNIPAKNEFRNCFEPRENFKWVSIDYSGQELCLMADRANEPMFIKAINNGEDLHSQSASLLFDKPISKKDKEERNASKTITFGLCYGMGADKLSDSLFISKSEAEVLLKKYGEAFPTLMKWLDKSGIKAKKEGKGVTQDVCKRIRWFPKMALAKELRSQGSQDWRTILTIEGSTEREGKNFLIQGSAANMTKESLVGIRNLVKEYKDQAFLVCTVHDQIDVEIYEDYAEEFAEKMKDLMLDTGNKYLSKVKIGADVTITNEWSK